MNNLDNFIDGQFVVSKGDQRIEVKNPSTGRVICTVTDSGQADVEAACDGSVLLSVPSAIVPRTFNSLFNPLHPQAREFETKQSFVYPFDMRSKC